MARSFSINFMGDVMLGRLIDQLCPTHVHEPEEEKIVDSFRNSSANLNGYSAKSPWGDTLDLLHKADLNVINLETSATTWNIKWPNKVFNYRMHPANIEALKFAKIHYAGLANNHSLDYSEEGLRETVETVKKSGIAFAGAGLTREEALRPAVLDLKTSSSSASAVAGKAGKIHKVAIWSASDHPSDWGQVPLFHLIKYSTQERERLRLLIYEAAKSPDIKDALKVFSVHWGPNYSWMPAQEIQSLARYLIDECGIDIIHGHSSHHVQGVEIYHGKLIIYGCGDFIDDYALVPDHRNDLSAVWQVWLKEEEAAPILTLDRLEIFPTRIRRFQTQILDKTETDHGWITDKIKKLSGPFNTSPRAEIGPAGQLTFDI